MVATNGHHHAANGGVAHWIAQVFRRLSPIKWPPSGPEIDAAIVDSVEQNGRDRLRRSNDNLKETAEAVIRRMSHGAG